MKRLALLFFLLCPFLTFAQFSLGLQAGVNFSNINISEPESFTENLDEDYQFKAGFDIGITTALQIKEGFRLSSAVLYSRKGATTDQSENFQILASETDLHYLVVPLVGEFQIVRPVWLSGGVEAGYLLEAKAKSEDQTTDVGDLWTDGDFALRAGLAWQVSDRLQLRFDYRHGLANIGSKVVYTDVNGEPLEQATTTNRTIALSLGYAFWRS